jgi:Xaa-Pro aminopeptidase
MDRIEECKLKVKAIRSLLEKTGHDGIVIRKQANFSWISAGGRGFVGLAGDTACAAIVVTKSGVYLAGNNIEPPRLTAEELPKGFAEQVTVPWRDIGTLDEVLKKKFGNLTTDAEQDAWFKETRVILMESEQARFAKLGKTAAQILEDVCAALEPGVSEMEIAGRISEGYWAAGLDPITLLIAADNRSSSFRHYVPTVKKVKTGAICSICARAGGLVVSATRTVAFSKNFAKSYGQLLKVEQAIFEATKPGAVLGEIFKEIIDAYAKNGLAGEWENHHQGGMAGYGARELVVNPKITAKVAAHQVYAWNPSAVGVKCEDTVLVGENGKLTNLTRIGKEWPSVKAGSMLRPDVLRK